MPPYRLTDAGKRLYWRYRAFTEDHKELTPDEFVAILIADAMPMTGWCLACSGWVEMLTSGLFCMTCIRGTVRKAK